MNTLSIDWEDFGQLLCRDKFNTITLPKDAIDRQTHIILDLLDKTNRKATFFILGMLADFKPKLVKEIHQRGHEVGIHGSGHIAMDTLTKTDAVDDLYRSVHTVESLIGTKVYGYRAPYFSVRKENLYVLEILAELGLIYDSSIFPMKMPRYGIEGFDDENKLYQLNNGMEIVELPITIFKYKGKRIPIAGGGYMRLMPSFLIKMIYKQMNSDGIEPMIYMHPYEFDSQPIDCTSNYAIDANYSKLKSEFLNLKWNIFRKSILKKLEYLLINFEFTTCKQKAEHVKNRTYRPTILG